MKENNVETRIVNEDLNTVVGENTIPENPNLHLNEDQDSLDYLLSNKKVVDAPAKKAGVGKKVAAAVGVGVVGAASAGAGAYAFNHEFSGNADESQPATDAERSFFAAKGAEDDAAQEENIQEIITGDDAESDDAALANDSEFADQDTPTEVDVEEDVDTDENQPVVVDEDEDMDEASDLDFENEAPVNNGESLFDALAEDVDVPETAEQIVNEEIVAAEQIVNEEIAAAEQLVNEVVNDAKETVEDAISAAEQTIDEALSTETPEVVSVEEPVVEPVVEPAVEPVVEPAVEPAEEPVVVTSDEPILDAGLEGEESDLDIQDVVEVEPVYDSVNISLAHVDTTDLSFNEAFAAARAEVGANGVFEWRGGYYGTYLSDEWSEMSDEFKQEFGNHNWAEEFSNGNDVVTFGVEEVETGIEIDGVNISLAHVDTTDLSFGEAFAAARAEVGANGVFEWRGGYYGTYHSDEWSEMSDEFKQAFGNHNWGAEFEAELAEMDDDLGCGYEEELGDIDVECVAENVDSLEESFLLGGDVVVADVLDEITGDLPGEILAGNFEVEVDIEDVSFEVQVEDDSLYAMDDSMAFDAADDLSTDDAIAGIDMDSDIMC